LEYSKNGPEHRPVFAYIDRSDKQIKLCSVHGGLLAKPESLEHAANTHFYENI